MNFMPEPIESKVYVDSLVTEYKKSYSEELNLNNTKDLVDKCYDSFNTYTTNNNSPSAATEFKRGDTCLEELDTNAETNSVPDTEFVSEYFDIYGSTDNLNKNYSTLTTQEKWEEPNTFIKEEIKDVDTTTTTTIGTTSDSCFKSIPFHSSNLFFEDDFRYITSSYSNNGRTYNLTSDYSDKGDPYTYHQQMHSFGPTYRVSEPMKDMYAIPSGRFQDPNKDLFPLSQASKDDLMDKAELATTSFAQITNTMVNFNSNNLTNSLNTNLVTNSMINPVFIGNNFTNGHIFGNTMIGHGLGINFQGQLDIKRPTFRLNTPFYNFNSMLDTDLYLSSSLTNKYYNLVSNYPANTNYCVYIGADYNKLVCNCNMNRPNGSNSHANNCNVVVGGVELSTESWPISKASQMYTLINCWDRVIRNYKKHSTNQEYNNIYQQEEHKPSFFNTDDDKLLKSNYIIQERLDQHKNANNLISEITGIKLNIDNNDQFSLRNAVTEHLRSDDLTKRRKIKHKNLDTQTNNNKDTEISSVIGNNEDSKLEKKEFQQQNTEKVSGVWYDTNRHLWRVVYMKGNKRKTQGFSSLKLGYEEARRKAIQMRHEMVALRHSDKI